MKITGWALGAVAALALSGSIGSAQAAPSGVSADLRAVAGGFSNVETVHRRRGWRDGHRHSRGYHLPPYRYYGAPYHRYYDDGPPYSAYGYPYGYGRGGYPYGYGPGGYPYGYDAGGYPYGYGPGSDLFFGHHHHGHH